MSLFAKYVHERTDKKVIEVEHGFATYMFINGSVYIEDIFVDPDYRRSRIASDMADKIAGIALEKGINKMLGTVVVSTKGCTNSIKALLGYGFELESAINGIIVLKKNLKEIK